MSIFGDNCYTKDPKKIKDIIKLASEQTDASIKCDCGHTVLVPTRKDKIICSWCGEYVFKDKETEFKYRMLSKLSK